MEKDEKDKFHKQPQAQKERPLHQVYQRKLTPQEEQREWELMLRARLGPDDPRVQECIDNANAYLSLCKKEPQVKEQGLKEVQSQLNAFLTKKKEEVAM